MTTPMLEQQQVLRQIVKALSGTSLARQLGLQRLASFKDFDAMYEGFCRAVPVQSPKVFMDGLAKMLPQGGQNALQTLQQPNLLVRGKPLAGVMWRGTPVPVTAGVLADHVAVETHVKKLMRAQGMPVDGGIFYLFEQEGGRVEGGEMNLEVPLRGWHEMLDAQRWFWERGKVAPKSAGMPQGGSRWQWFNAMFDQLKAHGGRVEMLVTHPKTLIDFGLYVSQQAGRFVPLKEVLPRLKVLALTHYDIGIQRTEIGYLLAGLPHVRWVQWLYNSGGLQMWQGDFNIRQRLDLLTGGNVFYEFIPIEDMDAGGRFSRTHRRFYAGRLELGREYNVVVSNLSGLIGVSTGLIVKVVNTDPLQVVGKGPSVLLHGLSEGLREDMVVEALGNINAALAGHGVFVREGLFGHHIAERSPQWVLEVSRPLGELPPGILESMAKRLHAELDLRCESYRKAYRSAVFRAPQVHFVPMGTFAAAFTTPPDFSQFDHSPDAAIVKKVLAAGWDSRTCEAV